MLYLLLNLKAPAQYRSDLFRAADTLKVEEIDLTIAAYLINALRLDAAPGMKAAAHVAICNISPPI